MKDFLSDLLRRFDFAILVLCLVCFHLPYFDPLIIPQHDTRSVFEYFHFFYNEFFFSGELAQWMPYYSFGIPSSYFQSYALTPASYFSFALGWLFKITDVLWLFKISVLGEYFIFLLGTYLLSRQIFSKRKTVFLICLASLCSPDYWYFQIFFSLRIFYMFPLAAYFLISFFRQRRPFYIWLSGLVVMAWMSGNPQYFAMLWAFVLFILGFIFFMGDKSVWRCLFEKSVSNMLCGVVFLAMAGAYCYQLIDIMSFAHVVSRGSGGGNSLGMFLTYGANFGYLKGFLLKHIFANDSEGYVGLFSVIFFVWALFKVRNRTYYAFLTATLVLMALSFGGIVAAISYFFPGLSYYRHIGHIYGLIKILFLLAAGFGLDHFWSAPTKTKVALIPVILGILIVGLDCLGISGEKLAAWSLSDSPLRALLASMEIGGIFFRFVIYCVGFVFILAVSVRLKKGKPGKLRFDYREQKGAIALILMSCCLVDIASFQFFLYKKVKPIPEIASLAYVTQTSPLQFQAQRLGEPDQSRQRDAFEFVERSGGISYAGVYTFAQFDPCKSAFRADFLPFGLDRLFSVREAGDSDLMMITGCQAPKLRVLSSSIATNSVDEAMRIMKDRPDLTDKVIVRSEEKDLLGVATPGRPSVDGEAKVVVKEFSANGLMADVDVVGEDGGWLVYADSFHPGWKAYVNEKKTPIYEAYLAFKAVHLAKGLNSVRFVFRNGLGTIMSYFIALFGFLVAGVLFTIILLTTFCGSDFLVKKGGLR